MNDCMFSEYNVESISKYGVVPSSVGSSNWCLESAYLPVEAVQLLECR